MARGRTRSRLPAQEKNRAASVFRLPDSMQATLPSMLAEVFPQLLALAVSAGDTILQWYGTPMPVQMKEDETPVTPADEAAHALLAEGLARLLPGIPVISEEGGLPPAQERAAWSRYLLVDPLDGTKGFLRQNGQFTVNVAYMDNHVPVAGIVHVPLQGCTYCGVADGGGAFRYEGGRAEPQRIHTNRSVPATGPVVLQSNVDKTPRLDAYLHGTPHTRLRAGSAYKFCLLAEGAAQLFPCLHPTWEWDTAAGHVLVAAAGGTVTGMRGAPLVYGKPTLLNDWFLAKA
ncbi:3'(2'),5'-bisphosphate nucleotidase CysQ [Desulfovibrio psychrotolerans]|uniref:3'(2'),5'-bisphosphate nucleotidase CysQ n=1 Tax=Desulfovibrio psychrotolerans TaxID=415242 RepID=A0A7J0BZI9_9BACT|nr:3'(2'),5'-bisphosphate nucleotidase CysQ [Desulfovibrio psychrotolerans]GFM38625.1 3'(2'),5'-bisphosphate nucleotidase CysQ [Desulfovibrio psychrotolerans]